MSKKTKDVKLSSETVDCIIVDTLKQHMKWLRDDIESLENKPISKMQDFEKYNLIDYKEMLTAFELTYSYFGGGI